VVFGADVSDSDSPGASVTLGFQEVPGTVTSRVNTGLTYMGQPQYVYPTSLKSGDGSLHQIVSNDNGTTLDGSGWSSNTFLRDSSGRKYSGVVEDPNGNQITFSPTAWTDTLNRQIPVTPGPAMPSMTPPASTVGLGSCPALNYPFQPVTYAYYWNLPAPNTPTSSNGSTQLVVCYASVYVRTNFFAGTSEGGHGPHFFDLSQNFTMLQSVLFPDGTYWAFKYDAADPNNPGSIGFADLLQVTLPTGGTLSYAWQFTGAPGCGTDIGSRGVQTRTVNANDGSGPHTWQYNGGIVTDPLGNDTVHSFSPIGGSNCTFYETQTQYYQGSHSGGTLLKTIKTDYQSTPNPYDSQAMSTGRIEMATTVTNVLPIRVTTTLPNGLVSSVETTYDNALTYHGPLDGTQSNIFSCDLNGGLCQWSGYTVYPVTNYTGSYGKALETREYDWGHGAPGPLLRRTVNTYLWQTNPSYLTNNFMDLVSSTTVYDGAGNQVAKTTYGYDEATPQSASITTEHNLTPVNGNARGNQTTVSHWLNTSNSMISIHAAYFDTGELQSSSDPLNHTTTHLYDSAYAGAFSTQTCSPVTNPGAVVHCVSGTYDFNTGLLTSLTNENATTQASGNSPGDSAHTATFTYDQYWRIYQAMAPPDPTNYNQRDTTTFTYSLSPLMVTRQKNVTTLSDYASAYFDGVGRSFKSTHTLPNGIATVLTTFDNNSRVSTVTNPFFTTSDPTYGVTQTIYDGLGRATQVIKQDGSIASVQYDQPAAVSANGNCTVATDEAGKPRKSCTDALGRLIEVDEPYPGTTLNANNYATLRTDGNFVLYNPANSALWQTGTSGTGLGPLEVQDDGNVVLYKFRWSVGAYRVPSGATVPFDACRTGDSLFAGQRLNEGQCLESMTGMTFALMTNGDLEIFDRQLGQITWTSGTYGHTGGYLQMQSDGNLVVYSASNVALWTSGTSGSSANVVTLESDGRLIMYLTVWNSGTAQAGASSSMTHPSCDLGFGLGLTGVMGTGQCFVSRNGRFELLLQTDGNLVLYDRSVTPNAALWYTGTAINSFSPGYALVTLYTYDTLGNLLRVEQRGATTDSTQWRVRTFTYNSLSQLLTATNPESGTISYAYDADGELLQKTSPAPNIAPPSSATQTVSYCYDELHRVTGKGYGAQSCPLASPVVSYVYDSGTNAQGRLVSLTDQAGTATYAYDVLGRLSTETRTLTGANNAAISKSVSYEYNLDGSLKVLHYPSGAAVTYKPWQNRSVAVSIPQEAKDLGSSINYITSGVYGPDLSLTNFISGSGGAASITNTFTYNKRLQPVTMSAATSSQTVFSIGYDFHLGNGDNGNVFGITNYKDANRNQTFTYDPLNRLTSAQNAGTDCTAKVLQNKTEYWGNSYTYDGWGNLLGKTITKCGAENLSLTADTHNWIHGTGTDYRYDVAGNMTYDATENANLSYDEENRITGANGYTYTYDGDGNRVRKSNGNTASSGTLYWYMTPGVMAETDLAGTIKSEYVFFDGERVARRDGPTGLGGVFYYFSDHLKTASVITDSAGVIKAESDYYPWGGELQFVNNDANHYKFTGKERDETGLDYFGARYYSNGLGRWVSADWSATPEPVPYADFGDPQTLNLYQFVGGNPATKADPDGHCPTCVATSTAEAIVIDTPVVGEIFALGYYSDRLVRELGETVSAINNENDSYRKELAVTGKMNQALQQKAQRQQQNKGQGQETDSTPEPAPAAGGAGARKGTVPPAERDSKRFFSRSEKQELKDRASGKCQTCDTKTTKAKASRSGTKHSRREGHAGHKEAWSKGGRTKLNNGQWQCRGCNLDSGANSK
jgi:RHS repeat-associated protein